MSKITHKNGGIEQAILSAVNDDGVLNEHDKKRLEHLQSLPQNRTQETNPIPFGYSATVELNNGQIVEIWYTCYHSIKHIIKRIIKIYE